MKKISLLITLLIFTLMTLQGCGYELGYAAGTAQRYVGTAVVGSEL